MLFSPVYTKSHPRRNPAFGSRTSLRDTTFVSCLNLRDAASAAPCISSISFASYPFRTLASHFQTSVSSNLFEINRFRTLCKIPGIGYPPLATRHSPLATFHSSPLFSVVSGLLLHNGAPQSLYFQTLPDSFHCNGGVHPLSNGAPSNSKALASWRFDPVGSSGFHTSCSTGHGLRPPHSTPRPAHNIQPCRGDRS
jgi:hypothetical protein